MNACRSRSGSSQPGSVHSDGTVTVHDQRAVAVIQKCGIEVGDFGV